MNISKKGFRTDNAILVMYILYSNVKKFSEKVYHCITSKIVESFY